MCNKDDALSLACDLVSQKRTTHAHVYKATALIRAGYFILLYFIEHYNRIVVYSFGGRAAQNELDIYFEELAKDCCNDIDPLALFVMYLIWKEEQSLQKIPRLKAADLLRAFRCFQNVASVWLTPSDNVDVKVAEEIAAKTLLDNGDDDDDDSELIIEVLPTGVSQYILIQYNMQISLYANDHLFVRS